MKKLKRIEWLVSILLLLSLILTLSGCASGCAAKEKASNNSLEPLRTEMKETQSARTGKTAPESKKTIRPTPASTVRAAGTSAQVTDQAVQTAIRPSSEKTTVTTEDSAHAHGVQQLPPSPIESAQMNGPQPVGEPTAPEPIAPVTEPPNVTRVTQPSDTSPPTHSAEPTAATTTAAPVEPSVPQEISVTIQVDCMTAFEAGNEIAQAISSDGWLVSSLSLTLPAGATAYDALLATGLVVQSRTSGFGVYVSSIQSLAEFAAGSESGWVYFINGVFANVSSDRSILQNGDLVSWRYTVRKGDL